LLGSVSPLALLDGPHSHAVPVFLNVKANRFFRIVLQKSAFCMCPFNAPQLRFGSIFVVVNRRPRSILAAQIALPPHLVGVPGAVLTLSPFLGKSCDGKQAKAKDHRPKRRHSHGFSCEVRLRARAHGERTKCRSWAPVAATQA